MIQYKLTLEGLEIYRVLFNVYYTKTFYDEYEQMNNFKFEDDERGFK